jgi:hypothetical protein
MMSTKDAMVSACVTMQHSSFKFQKYGVEYGIFITG